MQRGRITRCMQLRHGVRHRREHLDHLGLDREPIVIVPRRRGIFATDTVPSVVLPEKHGRRERLGHSEE
jgi:hypothetical protein